MAAACAMPCCQVQSLPLWEVGAGAAALSLPDYRGADSSSNYLLPIPYLVYRGAFLKADRNGVRSTLFESDRLEINVSLNATQPVHSKGNAARRGMRDLKPVVELGPTVDVNLARSDDARIRFDFRVPVRAGITLESAPRHIGWLISPSLHLDIKDPASFNGWNLGLGAGMLVQSRQYNEYFYGVGRHDASAQRPAYSASGGYAGTQFTAALSKRYRRHWLGGFLRYDNLAGAVFHDSPLVKKHSAFSAGIAIAWVLAESSVQVSEDGQ